MNILQVYVIFISTYYNNLSEFYESKPERSYL